MANEGPEGDGLEPVIAGVLALLEGEGIPPEGLREAIVETLSLGGRAGEGASDLPQREIYRIRLTKLAARLLPADAFRDPRRRARIRGGIRALVSATGPSL